MKLSKLLRKNYKICEKDLAAAISKWMKHFEGTYAAQLKLLRAGTITQRDFNSWCRTELLNSGWGRSMTKELTSILGRADAQAVQNIAGAVPDAYLGTESKALYTIDKATNAGASFVLHDENAVAAGMTNDLLPHINTAKDAAWNQRRLRSAITQGILKGESIDKIAKRIEGVAGANSKAAIRNARTAVNAAENAGKQAAYEMAEAAGITMTKVWLATIDDRTRDSHVEMDGEEVGIDEEFSNGLMYPCDPAGDDSEVYNCRCRMVTRVNGQELDLSSRVNKTGMDYEEWKDAHRR